METIAENQPSDPPVNRIFMVYSGLVLWYGILSLDRLAFPGFEKYGPDKPSG